MEAAVVCFNLITVGIISLAMSILGSMWVKSIGRNPEAAQQMFVPGILVLASIEIASIGCLGLLFKMVL